VRDSAQLIISYRQTGDSPYYTDFHGLRINLKSVKIREIRGQYYPCFFT